MNNSSLIFHSYGDAELAIREFLFNNSMVTELLFSLHFNLIVAFITCILMFPVCIAGIVGNVIVIRLLGFSLKRNPFTTYVLNLAVADIVVLLVSIWGYAAVIIYLLSEAFSLWGFYMYAFLWTFMSLTDQLLLTAISLDRCVAVLVPLWHRCHRPPHLSRTVCASMWVLSLLIITLDFILSFANLFIMLQFIMNVALCTPIVAISTVILFAKICMKSQQRKRGKLLPVISLALFLFLVFGFPGNYCYIVIHNFDIDDVKSLISSGFDASESGSVELLILFSHINLIIIPLAAAFACTILNCSVNPLIYFLMGRKKKGRSRASMKLALQRIFKEEGDYRVQEVPRVETQF